MLQRFQTPGITPRWEMGIITHAGFPLESAITPPLWVQIPDRYDLGMHGYLIVDLNTGKLLSSLQITPQFGFNRPEGPDLDPLYVSGLLFALCRNAAALDPNQESLGLALPRLETPDLALDLALDNRTATLSAVFFPSCIHAKTRRLICRELLELYLQYVQGLDQGKAFRKLVQRELFPAMEIYLAENVGLRLPRCPAWIIISEASHPVKPGFLSDQYRHGNVAMTSVIVEHVPVRRRTQLWSCCWRPSTKPDPISPQQKASNLCCYRILRLNSSQHSSFREQMNMNAIGSAAEAAASLLMEDELTQHPYRLADITVPGGPQSSGQQLLIAVRARVWMAVPISEHDIISTPREIACLAQSEIVALLDFVNYMINRVR